MVQIRIEPSNRRYFRFRAKYRTFELIERSAFFFFFFVYSATSLLRVLFELR